MKHLSVISLLVLALCLLTSPALAQQGSDDGMDGFRFDEPNNDQDSDSQDEERETRRHRSGSGTFEYERTTTRFGSGFSNSSRSSETSDGVRFGSFGGDDDDMSSASTDEQSASDRPIPWWRRYSFVEVMVFGVANGRDGGYSGAGFMSQAHLNLISDGQSAPETAFRGILGVDGFVGADNGNDTGYLRPGFGLEFMTTDSLDEGDKADYDDLFFRAAFGAAWHHSFGADDPDGDDEWVLQGLLQFKFASWDGMNSWNPDITLSFEHAPRSGYFMFAAKVFFQVHDGQENDFYLGPMFATTHVPDSVRMNSYGIGGYLTIDPEGMTTSMAANFKISYEEQTHTGSARSNGWVFHFGFAAFFS